VGVWLGQDATGEHRPQLPRQGSQGYAHIPPSHSDFFTYFCLSGMGKGAGTVYFTSIRRERGGPFTTCAYQISLAFPATKLLQSDAKLFLKMNYICFVQCVSRSLQTMAR
jgi:hypothetical protein